MSSDETPSGSDDNPSGELLRAHMYTRWQEPPAELLTAERLEKRRLADAMRAALETLIATGAPIDLISEAADELERIVGRFAGVPDDPEYSGYRETANAGDDPHASYEMSPFAGRANPLAPPIVLHQEEDTVVGIATYGSAYEGPPGCVHGGFIAAAFDEVLGATQSLSGAPGMTGTLTVRYRSPTPLHEELRMEGRIRAREGRKIYAEGTLHVGDRLCAEAEGIFISIDVSVFQRLKSDREERARAQG